MISVATNSYPTMMRAADQQAARLGLAQNGRQSVPVQVEAPAQPASAPTAGTTTGNQGRVINITV